jgi:metacaspase-1
MQGFSESESIGAMTASFIRAVKAEPGTTYGRLLSAMRATIRDGHGSPRLPGRLGSFVRRMIVSSSVQVRDAHVNLASVLNSA